MIRVAVVDVGSNAIRLVWQAVDALGHVRDEGYHRYGLRLGTDAFSLGKLSRQTTQDLVAVFHEIAGLISEHQIDSYRAVATAAMRAASNAPAVVKRIKRETGIKLEVI
ncbi:MAG: Ppx/GppA family phosphatase, partial [Deltaproteobacteria bacterium]|nr:Ppx/GppA family phosphatase [Deltaproteobacteria bacterium]